MAIIIICLLPISILATADIVIEIEIPLLEEPTDDIKKQEEVDFEKEQSSTDENALKEEFKLVLEQILSDRNNYILQKDATNLKALYDLDIKSSLYAYEHEAIKIKYLKEWASKQGIQFEAIDSNVKLRKVRNRGNDLFGMTTNVCTTFTYSYINEPEVKTVFKLGTSHYLHLKKSEDKYIIIKEWYTDPFADSLKLKKQPEDLTKYIISQSKPDYTPNERTKKAIEYAHKHCGIGEGENMFKYNLKKYMDCNPIGGDCANFASQIMFEGGGFEKNKTWNYSNEGTKAWVNAQGFTNYIIESGRGRCIDKGSYEKIYKSSFKLRPGDFVAYEKNDRITHVSTVTGIDNKGYPLVTCHNTDRLLVPYDLGWSNSNITFHLIDVYY
ncbi:amidase domain-containing protein [Candidatus Epulonipiscium fishelsonii]|uniref:Amidase domain-containing protein n=1 Tax=Candidatus Epulonipiscium fishelsonii TaxID=77094 RepID=A0ACC8XBE2_9FIRM|nr:amidase domain-containing protein [Epulopiscium sp. SCG-B11WGA-EpuloA1]